MSCVGLVLSGLLGLATTIVGWKGNKSHNKFLLVLVRVYATFCWDADATSLSRVRCGNEGPQQTVLDIVVAAVIVLLADEANQFTEPIYSESYKTDCLRYVGIKE